MQHVLRSCLKTAYKRLRNGGIAIIYINHQIAEIYELSDRVSVLRDGAYVGTLDRAELSAERLVQMMLGRALSNLFDKHSQLPTGWC